MMNEDKKTDPGSVRVPEGQDLSLIPRSGQMRKWRSDLEEIQREVREFLRMTVCFKNEVREAVASVGR